MEITVILLLLALIALVIFLLFKISGKENSETNIASLINEKFLDFQTNMHKAMEGARSEVERSKDIISEHAVKTLDTLKTMGETVERLLFHQKEAHELGNSLKYLLQTPKLRGSYGEEMLEEMLEKMIPNMWQRQYSIEGAERVDAVVKYKDTVIPIDAKFPRETYEKYLNAETDEDKRRSWKLYEDGIKIQVNSIKNKYIKPHKGTSNFAFMFIPSESIYYETIAEKNFLGQPCSIYEYARNNNVVPVSPNTLYAYLQIIIMGIRNLDIIKSAKKLQENLEKVERNFRNFYAKYEEIGGSLEKAHKAYAVGDTHIKRFKDSIDSTLKLELPDEGQNREASSK